MTTLPGFLTSSELDALIELERDLTFAPGRQGTGYEKAAVDARAHPQITALLLRSQRALGMTEGADFDCWLLRYPAGSEIPPHRDDAPRNAEHWRLNAAVVQPAEGGELTVDGARVALAPGDAIVFRPDAQTHAVSRVSGVRLVWSVGTLRTT